MLVAVSTFAQLKKENSLPVLPFENRLLIKTNVLSLVARRPTISFEKLLPNGFSAELCLVQGQFNNLLLTDHYDYSGFLLRLKKYSSRFVPGEANPFMGAYIGNLTRNIATEGGSDRTGWFSFPSRYFRGNSIRAGATVGLTYFTKGRLAIEGLGSMGYGRYLNLDALDPDTYSKGYFDLQVWLSVGYSF